MQNKKNIKNLRFDELERYIEEQRLPKFRAGQIFEWIYKDAVSFRDMTNLPKGLIELLESDFYIGRAIISAVQHSKTDSTRKYLLCFEDGNGAECVLMDYSYGRTICISTQIGCRMSCEFCASTVGGLVRSMTAGEMLEEVMAVSRDIGERIGNIVLMGTGEPFDNYDEVMKFIRTINHAKGLNIGQRHITLSTSGIVPRIYDFADEKLQCTLAVSLHGADDETRSRIMPVNRKYNIEKLMDACRYYIKLTNKRVTFEYALMKDVNDSVKDAHKLGTLLKGMLCHVNLIPVNKVEGKSFVKASKDKINSFKTALEGFGIETTIRRELGSDIDAACGQLRQKYTPESIRQ
ncbi:MAG: 23S rRNA (adenine(2503)-C(2))-methyltransferase RlmN [Clostridiaceae bacterium]|nr:23S rRNA (adenine(2503)-C(2))-methyltransferase RlmN [Clostridiaceae bacterium]